MNWCYQLVNDDGFLRIAEVFYNSSGEPWGYVADPCIGGDSIEDLRGTLDEIYGMLDEPPLYVEDITAAPDIEEIL